MMMNEKKEKIKFFFEKKTTIHIETYSDSFFNGLIIEMSDNLIVINDRVLGEIPIAFSEIKEIDRFREDKNAV